MKDKTRALADFKWCVQSPPLMQFNDDFRWPPEAWFETRKLSFEFIPTSHEYKLGLRFEAIIAGWIEQEPSLNLLEKNLTIHDKRRTIGEFDLIVDNNGTTEHWELAVKFYLGTNETINPSNWHGPDPSDTLAKKINRMESHQLKLSQHHAGKKLLEEKGWNIQRVRSLVKGRLFHPYSSFKLNQFKTPINVNPNHEKGWWLGVSEFESSSELKNNRFIMLDRANWFAPIASSENAQIMNHDETVSFLLTTPKQGTVPLALINKNGKEISRGFVVFPQWMRDVNSHAKKSEP